MFLTVNVSLTEKTVILIVPLSLKSKISYISSTNGSCVQHVNNKLEYSIGNKAAVD
jgi:hypothetical protein